MKQRWTWGLAMTVGLAGCQANLNASLRPDGGRPTANPASNPGPTAPASPGAARPDGTASLAPGANPAPSPLLASQAPQAQGFGIPARINLAFPQALTAGSSLLGNDGAGLIANDGGGLIANDGAALLANDGGSLLANDGAGVVASGGGNVVASGGGNVVASGGGNWRLLQSEKQDKFLAVIFPSMASVEAKDAVANNLLLYRAQAASLNAILQHLGRLRWVPGQVQATAVTMPIGGAMRANVLSQAGPAGTGPIIWLWEVGAESNRVLKKEVPEEMRRALPHLAIHLVSPTQTRIVWLPYLVSPNERTAFTTLFDLSQKRALAEVVAYRNDGTGRRAVRRARWAFDQPEGQGLRLRASALLIGDGAQEQAAWRRVSLQAQADGGVRFFLRQGPLGGPMVDVGGDGQSQEGRPQLLGLAPDGGFLGAVSGQEGAPQDPFVPELSFPGLKLFEGEMPPVPEGEPSEEANFRFPAQVPPRAPVVLAPDWTKPL